MPRPNLGGMIAVKLLPYPLPDDVQKALVANASAIRLARSVLGADTAEKAMERLDAYLDIVHRSLSVTHTRREFLPVQPTLKSERQLAHGLSQ